jgi:protein subunit release factor A
MKLEAQINYGYETKTTAIKALLGNNHNHTKVLTPFKDRLSLTLKELRPCARIIVAIALKLQNSNDWLDPIKDKELIDNADENIYTLVETQINRCPSELFLIPCEGNTTTHIIQRIIAATGNKKTNVFFIRPDFFKLMLIQYLTINNTKLIDKLI